MNNCIIIIERFGLFYYWSGHGGGGGFRSSIIAYAHYRLNGTIAPIRIDETGVGNYNVSATLHQGSSHWTIEAEDFYAIGGGAVKRQKVSTGSGPVEHNAFEVANISDGSTLVYPHVYSRNEKMQLRVVYSNGGTSTGNALFILQGLGKPYATCRLVPTGSWDTYVALDCGGASRFGANTQTGMMPDVSFNFTGPDTEFARIDAFSWQIY